METKVTTLIRNQQRIARLNYDPKDFMTILLNTTKDRSVEKKFLIYSPITLSITFLIFLDNWVIELIAISIVSLISVFLFFYWNFHQNKILKSLIDFWIEGVDEPKFNELIRLLVNDKKLKEFKYFIPSFYEAKSPRYIDFFPTFWDGMYRFKETANFFNKFSKKPFLIPNNYKIPFQTSIVRHPELYVFKFSSSLISLKIKRTFHRLSIVDHCMMAEYYLKYYFITENPIVNNSLKLYSQELKSIIDLVDTEKQEFYQLWDDKHLDANLRRVLREIYTIVTDHPEYTNEDPTIYHLLLKYATNSYLQYIAISQAIENIENFRLDLEQIPTAIEKVTIFCRRFEEEEINKKDPWEKLPIYWLFLLGLRQRNESPRLARLFCSTCHIFATSPEIIGTKSKKYHLDPAPDCVICPECKETKNLEYFSGMVIGIISDRIFFSNGGENIQVGLWNAMERKFQPAEFEKIIILPKLNIDYDWALVAVLENLPTKNENDLPMEVEIPSEINLKENTLRILKDFSKEGRIRVINL